jgi:diguanylate cyclase (GGDEF)-like protein
MYSFSSFTPAELMENHKREAYLIAFPIGMFLSVLYIIYIASSGWQLYAAGAVFLELGVFVCMILFMQPIKYAMEIVFYFSIPVYFFVLTQIHIEHVSSQNYLVLGDPVYSLSMWLILFLIGAFLSLKPDHLRLFVLFMFAGMATLAAINLLALYSLNDFDLTHIFRWVNSFICMGIATLLVQRIGLLQKQNATTDALTGMLNRHAFYPILNQELSRSARYARSFSIILLDVDEFKDINDNYGHLEGDKVLKELSSLVVGLLRKTDCTGRWGGEEFLILLPETEPADARILAERIREKIEETHFLQKYYITASFGVAAFRAGRNLETLLECADKALYQAKCDGRNQVAVCQDG